MELPQTAHLHFVENVSEGTIPLEIKATGLQTDLLRVAELLGLGHGSISVPGSPKSATKAIYLSRPTDIAGLTGAFQWNHGRTAIPQGTPLQ